MCIGPRYFGRSTPLSFPKRWVQLRCPSASLRVTVIVPEELPVKLAKITLENFRHLGTSSQPLEVSFTDALGRVRDFTLLVGPNTSGKTTILDAIALALGRSVSMAALRRDFKVSPRTVVRRGALHAKITCWLRFSPEEIAATRNIFQLAEIPADVPDAREVKLTLTYPAPTKPSEMLVVTSSPTSKRLWIDPFGPVQCIPGGVFYHTTSAGNQPQRDYGVIQSEPEMGWVLLHGRDQAARLLATGRADWSWFHRVGGVFTFDQERTGLGKTISRQVWNIIHGTAVAARENEELRTTDPRTILIELALQSLVPPIGPKGQAPDEFRLVQEKYDHVCHPRRLVGAVRDELGEFDIHFTDRQNEYTYEGLSSGEKNVLLLLIRFVAERMHRSVVLIDEMELNQHPIWQRKLLHMIPQMGDDNQIIATTHSPYLRDAVRPDAVIDLGDLGDHSTVGAD
jgi:predicted ATPase